MPRIANSSGASDAGASEGGNGPDTPPQMMPRLDSYSTADSGSAAAPSTQGSEWARP